MMRDKAVVALLFGASIFAGIVHTGHGQDAPAGLPDLPQSTPATVPAAPAAPAAPGVPDATAPAPMPDATAPAPMPGAIAPAAPGMPGTAPAPMPAMPGLPTMPGDATGAAVPTPAPFGMTAPGLPGTAPVATAPTPPPLGDVNLSTDEASASPGTTVGAAAAPSQTYSFLFVELPEYGVVRHKFNSDVAENLREQEIQRLMQVRRTQGQPNAGVDILGVTPGAYDPAGMGMPMGVDAGMGMGMAPGMEGGMGMGMAGMEGIGGAGVGINNPEAIRAAAEWDFYYNQMELYNKYVREKLIPNAEELPELAYDAQNALQERQDLFESFQEAAIEQATDDFNENKLFYERLAKREDRRRAYLEWLQIQRQRLEDWSDVWARKVYGDRWADGEEVRLDDWYYGLDFNGANPVVVAINDREYVVSRQPVRNLKDGQLNVISNNLTPYDIIDANGEMKNPVMETLRGTLVMPPAAPVYTTGSTTGTIEIVGGVTSE